MAVFSDNDISASTGQPRPGYEQLVAAVQAGAVAAVVCYHLDRLTRRPLELEHFLDLAQTVGLAHLATVTGDFDLGSDDARFTARILGAVARKESDALSRRIRRAQEQAAAQGRPHGGKRRFGYTADHMELVEPEAALVREAVDRVLGGGSVFSIECDWRARGIVGAYGGAWSTRQLTRMLTNPAITGLRVFRGEVVGEGAWPAIVERGVWERVQSVLAARGRSHRAPQRYLLLGLVCCGICGARLVALPGYHSPRGVASVSERVLVRRYGCRAEQWGGRGCGGVSIDGLALESFVGEWLLDHTDTRFDARGVEDPSDHLGGRDFEELRREADLYASTLIELDDDYRIHRVIDRGTWLRQRVALEARLDLARQNMTALGTALEVDVVDLHDYDSLDFDLKRRVVQRLVKEIRVLPVAKTGRAVEDRVIVVPHEHVVRGWRP